MHSRPPGEHGRPHRIGRRREVAAECESRDRAFRELMDERDHGAEQSPVACIWALYGDLVWVQMYAMTVSSSLEYAMVALHVQMNGVDVAKDGQGCRPDGFWGHHRPNVRADTDVVERVPVNFRNGDSIYVGRCDEQREDLAYHKWTVSDSDVLQAGLRPRVARLRDGLTIRRGNLEIIADIDLLDLFKHQ